MKLLTALKKRENIPLLLILLVAFILRFYKLSYESFWLDELHTMNEADPSIPFSQLFGYLRSADQHPPLFFFLERFIFSIFGRSEFTGRFLPALAGVGAVWAMYLLGKELLHRNLGLIAAAITCVNFFALYYSREARGYSELFLFAALSLVFLIRLIKDYRIKNMWYYSLFALLTMYSHYYGIFLVCSEFCVAFVLYFVAQDRKIYLKRFAVSALIIVIGYLPWVPFVLTMSQIKSFWIGTVNQDFIFTYFNAYFGNSDFLKPVLALLLLYYLYNVFRSGNSKWSNPTGSSLTLSFVVFSVCLVVTYTLPYIRSLLVVPMLFDRYTIVVLPIYLGAIAYGLELIQDKWAKWLVFGVFTGWSLLYIVLTNRTYTSLHKTQFREMTAFMAASPSERGYPVINDRVMWQEGYYLKKYGMTGPQFSEPRAAVLDSIIHETSPKYTVNGFWLFDAHAAGEPEAFLDTSIKAGLRSGFVMEKEQRWLDAWARLYISKKLHPTMLTVADFPAGSVFDLGGKVVAIWGGSVTSNAVTLPPGTYRMRIDSKGTPAKQEFPHVTVLVNDKVIGDYFTTADFQDKEFPFHQVGADSIRVTFRLENDFADTKTGEDRNAFVREVDFIKN